MRSPDWSGGRRVIRTRRCIWSRQMCSSTRCAADPPRGRACESTFGTSPRPSARHRRRRIPTRYPIRLDEPPEVVSGRENDLLGTGVYERLHVTRCGAPSCRGGCRQSLEFYDFLTYAFFAVHIANTFFPSRNPSSSLLLSLATFGAGFLMRLVGGVVIGRMGDRVGRKPAMLYASI